MDEVEKYQQRLQAIAEKRRLQEEEDRAKREMEDQKLRVQQLKRKSLRDQWLMEGPPASPDSPGPHSPVFSSPTEEVEAQIDQLQESQLTEGEREDPQEQQDNDKAGEVKEDGGSPEEAPHANLENGQQDPTVLGDAMSASPEDMVDSAATKLDNGLKSVQAAGEPDAPPLLTPEEGPVAEEAEVIPNGTQEGKEETAADPADEQEEGAGTNAPQSAPEIPEQEDGGTEAELGKDPAAVPPSSAVQPGKDLEDEDAGEIIRAERVIVTDEGDEPADAETIAPQDNAKEPASQLDSSAPPPESSAPPPESSASAPDSSTPPPESSASAPDSSAPPPESSASAPDNSAPPPESSASAPDSSAPPPESSAFAPESSAPAPESAAPPPESSALVEAPVPEVPEVPKPEPAEAAEGVQVPEKEPQIEASEAAAEAQTGAGGNVEEAPVPEAEPPAGSTEADAVAADVPVYPAELPSLTPQPEGEGGRAKAEEKEEAPASAPAVAAGQFQDIPLDGSAAKASEPGTGATEAPSEPTEQQALLDPSKAPPTRAEAGDVPKRKTCQCCSVM